MPAAVPFTASPLLYPWTAGIISVSFSDCNTWFFVPKKPIFSKINITCNLRAPDKPRLYAWAHLGCLTLKWCHIRKRHSRKAMLFCHNHIARHFQAFGDFTTFCTVSPGLVPLTHYVMIFQGWETNGSLRKIWQPIYTPKL